MGIKDLLNKNYRILLKHFGPQNWWPADSPWEVIVGAVLTQNTSWKNVEKAIKNLRKHNCLDFKVLAALDAKRIRSLIKPAGFFNQKSGYLKNIAGHIAEKYNGNFKKIAEKEVSDLRKEFLGIKGVGPETADSILLYAFNKPVFVIDAYTLRILKRWGVKDCLDYKSAQNLFNRNIKSDITIFNEYHALLVALAKKYCRKKPLCSNCPINKP